MYWMLSVRDQQGTSDHWGHWNSSDRRGKWQYISYFVAVGAVGKFLKVLENPFNKYDYSIQTYNTVIIRLSPHYWSGVPLGASVG